MRRNDFENIEKFITDPKSNKMALTSLKNESKTSPFQIFTENSVFN